MALPHSGQISFNNIRDEFDPFNSGQIELSDYYRGGLLVSDTAANIDIPLTGPIALSDFYGASSAPALTEHIMNYSTSGGEDACNGGTPVSVYQTTATPSLNAPIYTSAAGTTFRATGYYSVLGEFRDWNNTSGWGGAGAFECLGGGLS
jgi:hypothetical protein